MFIQNLADRKSRRGRLRKHVLIKTCGLKPFHLLLFLSTTFFVAFCTFSVTLYVNYDQLFDFIYLLKLKFRPDHSALSGRNLLENYHPNFFPGKKKPSDYDKTIVYQDFNYLQPETLTYRQRNYTTNEHLLLVRLPEKTQTSALLLIFHGCNHTAEDWFRTVERQRIIGGAVDLGYGCLVFQSTDHLNRCWSTDTDIYENKDVRMVVQVLKHFYQEYPELKSLPRFTFGESSGGLFSSIFAVDQRYPIEGQVLFVSIIVPEVLYTHVQTNRYPPTVWIHMLRDVEFASEDRINVSMQIFSEQKIPCTDFAIEPVRLSPMTFHERIPSITDETSRYLFYKLVKSRWLNVHNYLLHNPRRKLDWRSHFFSSDDRARDEDVAENIATNQAEITDFLNVIYGEHAISYERTFEAFKWMKDLHNKSQIKSAQQR